MRLSRNNAFVLTFLGICITLFVAFNAMPEAWFTDINEFYARWLGLLLSLGGHPATTTGCLVTSPAFSVRIIGECSGIQVTIIYVSFVLAFPGTWTRKLLGILLGSAAIFFANSLRLLVVFWAGTIDKTLFEYVHLFLGQVFMVATACALGLAWVKVAGRASGDGRMGGFLWRFFAGLLPLFGLWLLVCKPFVAVCWGLAQAALAPMGYSVHVPPSVSLVPDTLPSFNVVLFFSLLLASRRGLTDKVYHALGGAGLLFALHVLFAASHLLVLNRAGQWAMYAAQALLVLHIWILPMLFVLQAGILGRDARPQAA